MKPGRTSIILMVFAISWAIPTARGATTLEERFHAGNEAYHRGDLAEAIEQYRAIARYGVEDPALEYNLANALLRSGKVGEAILHYERALRLEPRARDVRHNLRVAKARLPEGAVLQLVRKGIQVGEGSEADWVGFFRALTMDETGWLLLLLDLVGFGLLVAWLRQERGTPGRTITGWTAAVVLSGLGLVGAYLVGQLYTHHHVRMGVVVAAAQVREGPSESSHVLFKAPEGLEVRLEDGAVPGWRAIRVNSELKGFVPASKVAPVDPTTPSGA